MKDQYLGDVSDYRKYGLLRQLAAQHLRVHIAWMRTADDGSNDGKLRAYLDDPDSWRDYDPELHDGLRAIVAADAPTVHEVLARGLVAQASDSPALLGDAREARARWFDDLIAELEARRPELVFFDPDNGFEVASATRGRRGSCKYLWWDELERAWQTGASVLVYQHLPRRKRVEVAAELEAEARRRFAGEALAFTGCVDAKQVLFLAAIRDEHAERVETALALAQAQWPGQLSWIPSAPRGPESDPDTEAPETFEPPPEVLARYLELLRATLLVLRSEADDAELVRALTGTVEKVPELLTRFADFDEGRLCAELDAIERRWPALAGRFTSILRPG